MDYFLLGSSSKWRAAAITRHFSEQRSPSSPLANLGPDNLLMLSPDIDEKAIRRSDPAELCTAIAHAKMDKIVSLLSSPTAGKDSEGGQEESLSSSLYQTVFKRAMNKQCRLWVLTSDQVAVFNGEIREKPVDAAENVTFLTDYQGTFVETYAALVVTEFPSNIRMHKVSTTKTHFDRVVPLDVIDRVIARGDSLQCCGGFVVDDEELKQYIVKMEPNQQAVEGLDVDALDELLLEVDGAVASANKPSGDEPR